MVHTGPDEWWWAMMLQWTWVDAVVALLLAGTLAGVAALLGRVVPARHRSSPVGTSAALVLAATATLLVHGRPTAQLLAVTVALTAAGCAAGLLGPAVRAQHTGRGHR
ncbi:hypothetical protein [Pseudonocardia phyllosphaerae]|uniref:hypothetical protein n=1 Tax=Pseudonocardia phyllosphaerae TaxID=3390502 RepID=UPI0039786F78